MANDSRLVKYGNIKSSVLEDTHVVKVLYALLIEGPTAKSVLYSMISTNNSAVLDRLKALTELGLVEEVAIDKPPYRAQQLTKKGREVAEHIEAIERVLNR
jgi:DNA-binding HxlR family transcriptional regulator